MSSKHNKGKNKGKNNKKGAREETEETSIPEEVKTQPTNDTINHEGNQHETKHEKEETSTAQGENTNTQASLLEESQKKEKLVQQADFEPIEVIAQQNESELSKIPPKVEQAIPVQIPSEAITTQNEVKQEQSEPVEIIHEALQRVQNVELSEIEQPSIGEVKVEESSNLVNDGHDQRDPRDTSVVENASSDTTTEVTKQAENSERLHVADEKIHHDPRENHQDAHEQKVERVVIDEHPPKQEQNHNATTQLLVDHNQHQYTHEDKTKTHKHEVRHHHDAVYQFQVRKATSQIKHEESQNQHEVNITRSIEVLHDEAQNKHEEVHHSHQEKLNEAHHEIDHIESVKELLNFTHQNDDPHEDETAQARQYIRNSHLQSHEQAHQHVQPQQHHHENASIAQPHVDLPVQSHEHHHESAIKSPQHHHQVDRVSHIQEQLVPNDVQQSSDKVIIDINQPIDEEHKGKASPKVEEQTFRMVESYEISMNESNQHSIGESFEIKRQEIQVKIPVKDSLSFSDLNVSGSVSQDYGVVQSHQPVERHNEPSNLSSQAPQIAEPVQKQHVHEQHLHVSSPVQILVSHQNSNSNVPNEQFFSIIPEPRQAQSSKVDEVKVEINKPVHAEIVEIQHLHHPAPEIEAVVVNAIEVAVQQPQSNIVQQVLAEQQDNVAHQPVEVHVAHVVHVEPDHVEPEVVVVNAEPAEPAEPEKNDSQKPEKDEMSELALSDELCIDPRPRVIPEKKEEKKEPISNLGKVAKGIISITVGGVAAAAAYLLTKNNKLSMAAAGATSVATYFLST